MTTDEARTYLQSVGARVNDDARCVVLPVGMAVNSFMVDAATALGYALQATAMWSAPPPMRYEVRA